MQPPRFRYATRDSHGRGQALVELALILPILMLLFLATVDLGRFFYSQITVTNAAREAALEAGVNPTSYTAGTCDAITSKVVCAAVSEARSSFVTVAPADVTLKCYPVGSTVESACTKAFGYQAAATVTGHFSLITPFISAFTGGSDITLASTARADVIIVPSVIGATPTPTPEPTPEPTPGPTPEPTPEATPEPTPAPCPAPYAMFSYTQHNKNWPVAFTSLSTPTTGDCAITSWRWDFGDSGVSEGNLPTVNHTYAKQNWDYVVKLTVAVPGDPTNITTEYFFTIHTLG